MLRPILAAVALVGGAYAQDDEHRATIRQMGYLAGDWAETRNGVTVEEHWVGPVGGVMAGVTITHSEKPGAKTRIEFMSIVEKDDTLVFIARPDGQPPTEFRLKEADNGIATFENPDHDFPQRVIYEIAGEDLNELKARIEGTIDGKSRAMDWSYKRLPR
mgnify:CR=1 FL=1